MGYDLTKLERYINEHNIEISFKKDGKEFYRIGCLDTPPYKGGDGNRLMSWKKGSESVTKSITRVYEFLYEFIEYHQKCYFK